MALGPTLNMPGDENPSAREKPSDLIWAPMASAHAVSGTLSPPCLQIVWAWPVVGWAPLASLLTTHLYTVVRSGAGGGWLGKRASA